MGIISVPYRRDTELWQSGKFKLELLLDIYHPDFVICNNALCKCNQHLILINTLNGTHTLKFYNPYFVFILLLRVFLRKSEGI